MMDHCEHVTRAHGMSEGRLARRYVAYYRVSTIQQGQFGFSIEAQRRRCKITSPPIPAQLSPSFPRA
jgi:hypothetical protein